MNIAIVGTGYVGLVAGACFAENGNDVVCVDVDVEKVDGLNRGIIPIYEPGLKDLVDRNLKEKRIRFTTSLKEAVDISEVIFIAVGTPQDEDGAANLSQVIDVAKGIGKYMTRPMVIVNKSTVPVGTGELVQKTIEELSDYQVEVVSNPEFLKEGAAIDDFMKPDRVVIGASDKEAAHVIKELYEPFVRTNNPILIMDLVSAELTKYASNAMLAVRVSFMNEIANLCEKVGADVNSVRIGMGTDSRIGMSFLFPGIGYGGSCFPKDVQALVKTGRDYGMELKIPEATEEINRRQKLILVEKVIGYFGRDGVKDKVLAVWGLSFKPRTDDVREAPSLIVIGELLKLGAKVRAFDPVAAETFKLSFGEHENLTYVRTNYEALQKADALILCTEWNEFRRPNLDRIKEAMKKPVIFDGRNIFDPEEVGEHGFVYHSIGRVPVGV